MLNASGSIRTQGNYPPGVISQFVIDRSTSEIIFLTQNNNSKEKQITSHLSVETPSALFKPDTLFLVLMKKVKHRACSRTGLPVHDYLATPQEECAGGEREQDLG